MSLGTLFVRDFAIVRRLELELGAGLTVLTGETGAGKSILIDALALALGVRAETDSIRRDADSAEVLAQFDIESDSDAAQWLQEQELGDDGFCITRRIVYRDKPSKAFVNGRSVTIQMLNELGNFLVDIHGQHEHQSLLRRDTQRRVLDDYAGLGYRVRELEQVYDDYKSALLRYNSLSQQANNQQERIDLLRYQIGELEKLDLGSNEHQDLEQEHRRLAHASDLLNGMQLIVHTLYEGDENTTSARLAECTYKLDTLADFEPELSTVRSLLNEAQVQVEEAVVRLRQHLSNLELDPQRLTWVEQRIRAVTDLARKHQCRPENLPETLDTLRAELSDVEEGDANLTLLNQRVSEIKQQYHALAEQISLRRKQVGLRLSNDISSQMQELGMRGGEFKINIENLGKEPTRFGYDQVEFLVSASRGQPCKLMSKVASGGELSRISLAIQVVTAAVGRIPCLIFDEVDVGIGGGVAEIVGRKLRSLGRSQQVLCITHLPQVAAQGHQHLQIYKDEDMGVLVNVSRLDQKSRVNEIARMLGGIEITKQTREHARDMLSRAQ